MILTLPPGPNKPLYNVFRTLHNILDFIKENADKYGDVVYYPLLNERIYQLNKPELIEEVFIKKQSSFIKNDRLQAKLIKNILGEGLFTANGEHWLRNRRMMAPEFHQKRIESYGKTIIEVTNRYIENWQEGETREIKIDMLNLALDVVMKSLFGHNNTIDEGKLIQALQTILRYYAKAVMFPIPLPGYSNYKRCAKEMDDMILQLISSRRSSGIYGDDLLGMLLSMRDENGEGLDDRQIRDEVMTLIVAGHETTSAALAFAFYLLSENPDVTEKMAAEISEVLDGHLPNIQDLPNLQYTTMVVNETLRLRSPAYILLRQAAEDIQIGEYMIPKDSIVLVSQYVMHRDPRYFEDPLVFRPERWADGLEKKLPTFVYFPFGGGPRMCIGQRFAMAEAVLILSTIVQRYKLTAVNQDKLEVNASITLSPKALHMVVNKRM
ncbi:cytochrome P450 [Brevibacillus laterosporus]|uniref:cytochrome P450 n=1 Tax=Brevibacillus laterosporus TaxID=1465 RepID=UPI000EB0E4F1|nr:cytochrome P450 [Brevibacillus laterosporus]AYK08202.1 cytochrome P450 [Brevibacillus laterosporus]